MNTEKTMKVIARIRSDFPTKFGIPRQSGLVKSLRSSIIFEPEYRNADALKGLEAYSHIWLIWSFSEAERETWSPTVRPPRLGGNDRRGVFATRSPFRPNAIGLSSVKIESIESNTDDGPVIHVSGADMMNGTPIFDIKPYLPYTDCHVDATDNFSKLTPGKTLKVELPDNIAQSIKREHKEPLMELLAQDPRPAYQNDNQRIYGFFYADMEVKFKVDKDVLTIVDIINR